MCECACPRVDGVISREGSVELRGALLELSKGLWLCDPATRPAFDAMTARGKPPGVIACAFVNRTDRIGLPWSATRPPKWSGPEFR